MKPTEIIKKMSRKKEGSWVNTGANRLETVVIQNPIGYDMMNPTVIKWGSYKGYKDSSPHTNQYM